MRVVLSTPSGEVNPLDHLPVVLGAQTTLGETHHGISVRVSHGRSLRSFVSQRHAELAEINGDLVLRDLGSANGTFLNGERLLSDVPSRPLKAGDVFTLSLHPACRFQLLPDPRTLEEPPTAMPVETPPASDLPAFVPPVMEIAGDERSGAMKAWLSFLRGRGFRRFLQATQPLSEAEQATLRSSFAWTKDPETRRLLAEAVGVGRRPAVQRHLPILAENLGLAEDLDSMYTFLCI